MKKLSIALILGLLFISFCLLAQETSGSLSGKEIFINLDSTQVPTGVLYDIASQYSNKTGSL